MKLCAGDLVLVKFPSIKGVFEDAVPEVCIFLSSKRKSWARNYTFYEFLLDTGKIESVPFTDEEIKKYATLLQSPSFEKI